MSLDEKEGSLNGQPGKIAMMWDFQTGSPQVFRDRFIMHTGKNEDNLDYVSDDGKPSTAAAGPGSKVKNRQLRQSSQRSATAYEKTAYENVFCKSVSPSLPEGPYYARARPGARPDYEMFSLPSWQQIAVITREDFHGRCNKG